MTEPTYGERVRQDNIAELLGALGDVEITAAEHAALKWLAGYETHTVSAIASAIGKARRHGTLPEAGGTATCPHGDVITEADLGELPVPLRITTGEGDDMKDLAALVRIGRCPGCDRRVAAIVLQLHWSPIPMFVTLPVAIERGPGAYRADAGGWSL